MKRVIIDTDPGIDDTAAIFFALTSGALQVEMLTTVFGNTGLENATRNALRILEAAGREDIPVYRGAARPLLREPQIGSSIHGDDGLGNVYSGEPKTRARPGRAVERIIEHVMASPGEITLLALGPVTNVALALSVEPVLANALQSLVVMGGAVRTRGNITSVATANLYNDPDAAAIVYRSGAPVVQIGMDVCRPTLITHRHLDQIRAADNPMARMLSEVTPCIMAAYERNEGVTEGAHYNDVPAAAFVIDPSLFKSERLPVKIDTESTLTRGQTVVDWRGRWGMEPNVEICLEVDAARLADTFAASVARGQVTGQVARTR
ncbi:MAG: nucleoside hydrolase [Chloroflexi bacterium]|nr:nucleoside hydrolase [Chloroflexota bacterium]